MAYIKILVTEMLYVQCPVMFAQMTMKPYDAFP